MRKLSLALGAGLITLATALPAAAQDEGGASGEASFSTSSGFSSSGEGGFMGQYHPEAGLFEVGLFGGLIMVSEKHNLHDEKEAQAKIDRPSLELGLRLGYFPLTFLGAEAEGAMGFGKSGGESANLWAGRLHGVLQLPGSRITPFLVLGGGRLGVMSDKLGDDGDPSAHVGIGAKMALTSLLGVRLDLRDNVTTENPETRSSDTAWAHHPEALLGLYLTLGRTEKPSDRDGDGFLDKDDKCPDEKGVAPDGCPVKDRDQDGFLDPDDKCPDEKGVAPDGCPIKDRDGDGFLDPDDKCPDEKGVAPDGCPDKDPDKDGILDPNDQCPTDPETKNGFQDEDGCPDEKPAETPKEIEKVTGVMKGIVFDHNKSTIRKDSTAVLDEAVTVLKNNEKIRVLIIGHTSSEGSAKRNDELSKARAESVKKYLVGKGIKADRLETKGAGSGEPIASNDTPEGKEQNRRIEFKVLEQ